MTKVAFGGGAYECRQSETVIEALLRHKLDVPYSCKKGVCLSCMLRVTEGAIPKIAQVGIRDTLRAHTPLRASRATITSWSLESGFNQIYPFDPLDFLNLCLHRCAKRPAPPRPPAAR